MSKSIHSVFYGTLLAVAFLMLSGEAFSAPQKTREMAQKSKPAKFDATPAEGFEEVDLFQAIADGKVDAGVIQAGMENGKLFIENKSDKPISVKLPETFGTRPVLAQIGGAGTFNRGNANNNRQLFGSGGMMGGGGGFMNIPPEKVVAVKYQSLCLDYGKAVPTATDHYELATMDDVTDKEEVKQICKMLGHVDQKSLQFAAWHLNSGTPIQTLMAETFLRSGRRVNFFTPQQVQTALAAIQKAKVLAQQVGEKTGSSEYSY